MSIEKPSRLYLKNYCLIGILVIFTSSCDEPPPPIPKTELSTPTTSTLQTKNKVITKRPTGMAEKKTQKLVVRKLDSEKIRRGEIVYQANCAICHGKNGESKPNWRKRGPDGKFPPPPLNGSAHTWHHSTDTLSKVIKEGSPPEIGGMPAWGDKLSDQEIGDVIVWITSIWPDEIYDIWYKEIEQKQEKRQHKLN